MLNKFALSLVCSLLAVTATAQRVPHSCSKISLFNTLQQTHLQQNFDFQNLNAKFTADPRIRFLKGMVSMQFSASSDADSLLLSLADEMKIDSVKLNGSSINFERITSSQLNVHHAFTDNSNYEISIWYHGVPPNTGFGSFSLSEHASGPVLWTLSQPFGAKDWWPSPTGTNDKFDSISVDITTPKPFVATSNGLLMHVDSVDSMYTYHWQHRYPIANYLVAFAISNYAIIIDTIESAQGKMLFENYVYPQNTEQAKLQIAQTKNIFLFFEDKFGPYPFSAEKYGHTQCNFSGGMEHQTNSFMNNFGRNLIAHELAHQWFGNKVTCASWTDVWLNEGAATYLTYLVNDYGVNEVLWEEYKTSAIEQITRENDGSVYVDDTTNVSRIFDYRLSYLKGSYLFHMLRWTLGDSAFYAGCKNYLSGNLAYRAARTKDFQNELELSSGKNLDEFFQDWFYAEGFPIYKMQWKQNTDLTVFIQIDQSNSSESDEFFEMSIPLQLLGPNIDTTITLQHLINGQSFLIPFQEKIRAINFDPHRWILCRSTSTNIDDAKNFNQVSLVSYPNPGVNDIQFEFNKEVKIEKLRIFSTLGKEIYQSHLLLSPRRYYKFDANLLENGAYIFEFTTSTENISTKIIISR